MVTSRTLLAGGLAVIAIIALASVVLLQQVAISQLRSQTMYVTIPMIYSFTKTIPATQTVTQTVTPQIGSTTTSLPTGPYVLIAYSGQTLSSGYSCTPASGNAFLAVMITVQNHGYDSVFVSPIDFYVVIGNQQYAYSPETYSCIGSNLSSISVLNGLSVTGWLLYEVPANYGTFNLLWDHPSSVNVQYVHQ